MLGHGIGSDNALHLTRPWLACTQRLFEPTAIARLRARLRRLSLDRALAAGADQSDSPVLAARACQLVQRGTRHRLAKGLERLALATNRPPSRFGVLPRRQALEANHVLMLDLADRLRKGGPLYARGIAMLELVLIDGTGPAYTDAYGEGLTRQLELAGAGLGG